MSSWSLLAGIQALCIYIIIRVDEGETEHNNLDVNLITTISVSILSPPSRSN